MTVNSTEKPRGILQTRLSRRSFASFCVFASPQRRPSASTIQSSGLFAFFATIPPPVQKRSRITVDAEQAHSSGNRAKFANVKEMNCEVVEDPTLSRRRADAGTAIDMYIHGARLTLQAGIARRVERPARTLCPNWTAAQAYISMRRECEAKYAHLCSRHNTRACPPK